MAAAARNGRKISLPTVERLSIYRHALEELHHEGIESVHSHQLAALVGVTPAQLRRDLATFGTFGNIARGYDVRQMSDTISRIFGTDELQNLAIVGVGYLGQALLAYQGFEGRGFRIVAAFDVDPDKTGRVFAGRRCYPLDELEEVISEQAIRMLVLTSHPEGLQDIIDRAAAAGVRGFLNFVPKMTTVPSGCFIEPIDISAKLEKLSFLSGREASSPTRSANKP